MGLKKPVDWDELYPGRFLKAGELQGRFVTLTIADLDLEELESDAGKKIKGVLSFKETTKQIPLNKTNGICLREMFGRKVSEWIGKRVTWFPGEWNGEPCIRIYGSPHLDKDRDIEVALPRRKPTRMTMHAVRPNGGQKRSPPAQVREPVNVPGAGTMDDSEPPPDDDWEAASE